MKSMEADNAQLDAEIPGTWSSRLTLYVWAFGILWSIVVSGSLVWNVYHVRQGISLPLSLGHGLVWLFGLMGLGFAAHRLMQHVRSCECIEEGLRASETRYRRIVEMTNEGICELDRHFLITFVNPSLSRMLGYSADEGLGRSVSEFMFEEDLPDLYAKMAEREAGDQGQYEWRLRRKDGSACWVLVLATALRDEAGRFAGSFAMLTDITERKAAELALKESEERFRTIFESAQETIFIKDRTLKYVLINPAMEQLFKRPVSELVGKDDVDLFDAESAKHTREVDVRVLAGETVEEDDSKVIHGDLRTFHVIKVPMRDQSGKITGLCGIARDITDRKRAEDERIHLAKVMEQIAEGIVICDKGGIVQYVNPAFEHMSGFGQDEMIGRHVSVFDRGFQDRYDLGATWNGAPRESLRTGRFTNLRKDGSSYQVEATISPVRDKSNTVTNYISVQRDVTREIALEAQLRQAQKLEAIGTLSGGIAHDFNNVLSIIMGYLELAGLAAAENAKCSQHIKEALSACRRAKDLTRQILSISRDDDKTDRLHMDIRPTVKEVIKFFKASLPSTIEIHQKISGGEGTVLAHPTQIHQVVTNLCANAAHAMEETGGILEVSLTDVDFEPPAVLPHPDIQPGPYVRLTVADTGHGMDSATLQRIFDPYFTTKEAGKGTGLGLAVVHGIVKNHDGVITVSSEVGKGSLFHVFFPRIDKETASTEEARPSIPKGTERILFVDDEVHLVNIWQEALEALGYMVTVKTSCLEALELFRIHPDYFDLVITDYTMPHMNGIDLARQLMRIRPNIPVILCSGLKEGTVSERTRGVGLRSLLTKPLELLETAEAIRSVLDNK